MNSLPLVFSEIKKEITSHTFVYSFLFVILLISLFLRTYRTEDLLGFYYDQGRDALVIWRLWHEGRPFLVGPVTGLAGIFLGPFYYYLIAPFYLIGGGDPIYPAVFLSFTTVLALIPLYLLGWKIHSRLAGLFAAVIGGLSFHLIIAGRWLSNPTPMFLMSVLILWVLLSIANWNTKAKQKTEKLNLLWVVLSLLLALSLQLESASAVFYLPVVLVFAIWQRNLLPNLKTIVICGLVFFISFIPQIIFNVRHNNIIFSNFARVLFAEKSFKVSFWEVFELRLAYIWNVFNSKILADRKDLVLLFSIPVFYSLVNRHEKYANGLKLLAIFIFVPIVGYFAFQGNSGNIYDYYMTGYYYPLILFFSIGLAALAESKTGKLITIIFFTIFIFNNLARTKNYLLQGMEGESQIKLGTELAAVNWVLDKAVESGEEYNVKLYVPPIIPHSYEYLLEWRGFDKCGADLCNYIKHESREHVYVIYEKDPINPERFKGFIAENERETQLVEEKIFGGVTAQMRIRYD